jgi:hypothetical protein|tara:strand:+ start:12390 stop:12512 length:123 start_codon:yes stop_codon:yes gene_type:complete
MVEKYTSEELKKDLLHLITWYQGRYPEVCDRVSAYIETEL